MSFQKLFFSKTSKIQNDEVSENLLKSYRNVRYSTGYFEAPAIKISYVTVISGLMTKVILSRNSVQMKKYIYGVGVK